MDKVAIVVLNFLNYKDTIECVDSILKMSYSICGIIIVDNGSYNHSCIELKNRYKKIDKVKLLINKKNQGYAKGNNLGIDYARKTLKADFVLVVNNDTIFIERDYIKKMLSKYRKGVGVIGSKVLLQGDREQSQVKDYLDLKNYILIYLNLLSAKYGSCFEFPINQGEYINILHGCNLLFTPDFFNIYKGFYKHTFLYGEESILFLMCKCKNLEQIYVSETRIFHKEDQSSLMSFKNDERVIKEYILHSTKYIIYWIIKYKIKNAFRLKNILCKLFFNRRIR